MSDKDKALENIKTLADSITPELRDTLLQSMQAHTGIMQTPRMLAYQQIREETGTLNGELLDLISDEYMIAAARALDSIEGEDFVYVEEVEMDYRLDFMVHDFCFHEGKTLVQKQLEKTAETDLIKREALTIKQSAKTSLYAVTKTNPLECTFTLRNLMNKAEPLVTVTDIGLSRSLKPQQHLLFTRIMRHSDINICSGMAMLFTQRKYDKLYKAFEKRYKKLPSNLSPAEKRFIAFFHVNREFGEPIKTRKNEQ